MHPTSVAGYQIVEKIGCGGMGVVYRARDELLERDLALKYVAAAGEGRVERLIHEARVASSLKHPGIVTIYGFIAEGPCIAMEYIHGRTLSSLLASGEMPLDSAARLGLELAEALHYAHQSGVVHADLKPANIMVDHSGGAKILDFGLAHWRLADELQTLSGEGGQLQQLAGTVAYMSPELLMGRPLDSRSDIFSLGCVLFELFTGQRPFSADNAAATLNALLNSQPAGIEALRRRLPAALSELVLSMLEKDPQRRLSTLGEALPTLRHFYSDTRGRPAAPARWSFPRLKPRRWWLFFCAIPLGLLFYFISEPSVSERQLRVFLAEPEYYRQGEGTALDAVIWSSVVNGLHLLGSVQPLLDHKSPVEKAEPAKLAKLAGADEWIQIRYLPENPLGNVQLQRVRSRDGALLEQVQFSVPQRFIEQSAQAVLSQTLALYDERQLQSSGNYVSLSADRYHKFVEIYSALNQGIGDRKELFDDLVNLLSRSPVFPAGELLSLDLAHDLFSDTQDRSYLKYSRSALMRLSGYYPNPLVVLQREITLSMDLGEMQLAENLLQDYERLSPGDPSILISRARLEQKKGDLAAANRLLRGAAATSPLSWSTRYKATSLAIRVGDVKTARNYIADALKITPGNTLVLGQLGLVELLYGDLDLAISTYGKLLSRKRHRSYLVNLGLAMMLKGEYGDARGKFVTALELQPGHLVAMLNLADVEMALDNREVALGLYSEILNAQRASGSTSAYGRMVEAQCLVHLGKKGEAIKMTLMALLKSEGDPEIAYQASLVYALAGDNESALVSAQTAIEGGMDKRWFSLPAFSGTSLPAMLGKE